MVESSVLPNPVLSNPVPPHPEPPNSELPNSPEPANPDSSTLLNRPEAVVFILLATLIVLWDTYLELIDEVNSSSLSARQLARRLGITQKVIRTHKRRPDFSEWTQKQDPEGIAWVYNPGGVYTPRV